MTTSVGDMEKSYISATRQRIDGRTFDWAMIATSAWLLAGGYLDAWAHNHIPSLESFFTPWHGILYSGFLVVAIVLLGVVIVNHTRGYAWHQAVPPGYELSLLGVFGFVIGGIGDMFWHILFGIERNIDAQLSPTHLLLMVCFGLIMAGPLRAAWRRSKTALKQGLGDSFSLLCALTLLLSVFTLITQTAHPFSFLWPTYTSKTQGSEQTLAVVSIIFQTIVLMGLILLTVRRWRLPFGFFTLLLTLNALLLSFMQDHYIVILIAAVTGVIADAVYQRLQPSVARVGELRLFAGIVPIILYIVYFLALLATSGIVWSIHLSIGSIIVAGITGWLLSYLVVPPREAEE